jgi:hypothetical protein
VHLVSFIIKKFVKMQYGHMKVKFYSNGFARLSIIFSYEED